MYKKFGSKSYKEKITWGTQTYTDGKIILKIYQDTCCGDVNLGHLVQERV